MVLGLQDILDAPATVRQRWHLEGASRPSSATTTTCSSTGPVRCSTWPPVRVACPHQQQAPVLRLRLLVRAGDLARPSAAPPARRPGRLPRVAMAGGGADGQALRDPGPCRATGAVLQELRAPGGDRSLPSGRGAGTTQGTGQGAADRRARQRARLAQLPQRRGPRRGHGGPTRPRSSVSDGEPCSSTVLGTAAPAGKQLRARGSCTGSARRRAHRRTLADAVVQALDAEPASSTPPPTCAAASRPSSTSWPAGPTSSADPLRRRPRRRRADKRAHRT